MRLHVEALLTHDALGQLARVNEPNGAVAPRFFLGSTPSGIVLRFRADLSIAIRQDLERIARELSTAGGDALAPIDPAPFQVVLAPVQGTWTGPAFAFPGDVTVPDGVAQVQDSTDCLTPDLSAWIPDVATCQPMLVRLVDGRAVSICASVRRTPEAHEAGVETPPVHRGHGYAADAVAAWASAVRAAGAVPLYSTSWANDASRAVARRLKLVQFGSDLHIT